MKKICIIGMGNMGKAIYDSLCSKKLFEVKGCDRDGDINESLKDCDAFVIAIKPQDFDIMSDSLSDETKSTLKDKLVISIMAGVSTSRIKKNLAAIRVVRVMPNLPLKIGAALSGWFSQGLSDAEKEAVKKILQSFGDEIEVDDEKKIDAITALSGSGPAYYYNLNRALRMKALAMGFSDEDARKIVSGTFLGASKLLEKGDECSGKLISRITSKGGTTEAALNKMEEDGFEKIVADGVDAAYKRAQELNG